LKENSEAEGKFEKTMKEKDEAEQLVYHIQTTVQNFYREIPEAPIVIEATM